MLKLGSSKPWQDAMEAMTGQRDVLATPLLNYFEPLRVWLEAKNKENGEYIGWDLPADVEKKRDPVINKAKARSQPQIKKKEANKIVGSAFPNAFHTLRKIRL